mmetsp:Transcript_23107/g.64189  ORF Transcript_23107/g.64189 Transcript_23107/m.64189 type:complete len:208 (-) Transcript_23107:2502-3125(-)
MAEGRQVRPGSKQALGEITLGRLCLGLLNIGLLQHCCLAAWAVEFKGGEIRLPHASCRQNCCTATDCQCRHLPLFIVHPQLQGLLARQRGPNRWLFDKRCRSCAKPCRQRRHHAGMVSCLGQFCSHDLQVGLWDNPRLPIQGPNTAPARLRLLNHTKLLILLHLQLVFQIPAWVVTLDHNGPLRTTCCPHRLHFLRHQVVTQAAVQS